jgi:predicted nucleic acid-binding Zn ribbon protein
MNCPHCGTYNPKDRHTCWRCGKELPPEKTQKKKDPQKSAQRWMYALIAIFLAFSMLRACGVEIPFFSSPQPPEDSTGYLFPRPPIAYQIERPWSI